jgi:hypothetical protein
MSYKQFSNLVAGKNKFYEDLVKKNGKEDPLNKTLLIIDEAHKLYGGADLSSTEKPDMDKLHRALMHSYKVSGNNSVKLLMMTGTPITNDPMEMIKLINLCKEQSIQMQDDFDKFSAKYLDDEGKFTKKGKWRYLNEIAGYVSYLSRERDARQFAQPIIQNVRVDMSVQDNGTIEEIDKKYKAQMTDVLLDKDVHMKDIKSIKSDIKNQKRDVTKKCSKVKKADKDQCVKIGSNDLKKMYDELQDKEASLLELSATLSDIKKEYRMQKAIAKNDPSQQGTLHRKCLLKSQRKDNSDSNSGSNSDSD